MSYERGARAILRGVVVEFLGEIEQKFTKGTKEDGSSKGDGRERCLICRSGAHPRMGQRPMATALARKMARQNEALWPD